MYRGQTPRVASYSKDVLDMLVILIRRKMAEQNLSANKLAKFAHVDQGSLSKALARKINFSNRMFESIAKVLGEDQQQMYYEAVGMAAMRNEKLSSPQAPHVGTTLLMAELMLLVEHLSSAKRVCELLMTMVAWLENPPETVPTKEDPEASEIVDTPTS